MINRNALLCSMALTFVAGSALVETWAATPAAATAPTGAPPAAAAAGATTGPAKPTGAPARVRSIEGVTEYNLRNGLQVLLFPDESSATVTVNVTYKVGSRFESYGETGMAHLLEHMNFKGTPTHPNIPNELSSHGAEANATTGEDRTNYFETFPATEANVVWALGLESDRMVHSFIAQKDLDSEMTVVRNEFERGESSPSTVLRERVLETAYLWHNYGHPTIGARADIEHVPIHRLQNFYHTYYQPDNATLIVAGKFDLDKTLALIQRDFGTLPKPSRVLPNLYTAEPTQDGEREVTLRRAGGQKVLIEAYHIPADAQADSAAIALLASLINDRPSGRLYQQLIATKLAVQASVSPASLHDPGYIMFSVVLSKDGDLPAAHAALDKLIAELATRPFTAAELERAQTQNANDFEKLMTSSDDVASTLSENVAAGDWRLLFWDRDQMRKVTAADIQRISKTYFISSNLTVGTFIPDDAPLRAAIPAAPPLDAMLKGYAGSTEVAAGERFDATPANIEARTHRSTIGRLKTAFLEKKTRGDRVNAVLELNFGTKQALRDQAEAGRMTAALLMRGTQKHTRQQLEDELTRLKATMRVSGSADAVTVALETTRDNLPQLLQLAAEVLREPAFPADQLDELRRQRLAQIESARGEPQPLAVLALRRSVSPYAADDFRYVPTLDESAAHLTKLSIADLQQFHQHFYGASHGEVAIVGSFDSAAATKVLTDAFSTWQSASAYERAPAEYKDTSAKLDTIKTPDKANAVFFAGMNLRLRDDDPRYPALEVGNAILGGGFLNSRLATRIRQKDGVSYSVESEISVDSLDPVGFFDIFAICAPQNIGKVEQGTKEEIARILQSGVTADEVTAASSGILQALIVQRSSDAGLAGSLVGHLYDGRDFSWDAKFEAAVAAANPGTVQAALKLLDPSKLYMVEAGDFH